MNVPRTRVDVRLPPVDARRLARLSAGLDRSASATMRLALARLDDAAPAEWDTPPELRQRLDTLGHAVNQIGNNVNQVAKLAHLSGLDAGDLDEASRLLSELIAELREAMI